MRVEATPVVSSNRRILIFIAALALACCAKTPPAVVWTQDYAAAVKQAKTENKNLLLYYSGSDWCDSCLRLGDEVFSKPAFIDYANAHCVAVMLDFPRKKTLPESVRAQNDILHVKYAVQNEPTIVLATPDEKVLAWIEGYKGEGATGLIDELEHPKPVPALVASQAATTPFPAPNPAPAK